ncbi:PREDICTED: uncharacterized protein LOC104808463 [Tarenaya hassleriana]|uniref:uncharacterized protein LOC104808463 n=1 Tax=Tarenaya hassleriana TaxID=28532 RepID=UPI00053C735F|nr:PREDICTED: uncharacterized protein LOC104808463 [Tarenaya hassleriana]
MPKGPRLLGVPRLALVSDVYSASGWSLPPARGPEVERLHLEIFGLSMTTRAASPDHFYWSPSHSTDSLPSFFSKTVWRQNQQLPPPLSGYKSVWFSGATPKHAFMVWLTARNRLPARDRLNYWGLNISPFCLLCNDEDESTGHLYFNCGYTIALWTSIFAPSHIT